MRKIIVASAVAWAVGAGFWSGVRSAGADGLYLSIGVGDTEAAAGPLGSRNTTIDATALNQTFTIQVFADVYGNDADGNNEGLQDLNFSLVNAATGTTGTSISGFHPAAPFNAAPTFQPGADFTVVTNGVTNVNRGSANGGPVGSYIFSHAAAMQINSVVTAQNAFSSSSNSLPGTPIFNSNGNGSEFYLGSATITITHLGSDTSVNALPDLSANGAPVTSSGLWFEDAQFTLQPNGNPRFTKLASDPFVSTFGTGAPLTIVDAAGDFTWTGTNGNNWDTTSSSNWVNASAATAYANAADHTNPNTAIFNLANPASIPVTTNIDVGNILFTTGGWTLADGGGTLAYGAAGPIVITTTTGVDTIIARIEDSSPSGSATGLIKLGRGTLILGSPSQNVYNTYSGGTTISDGTLVIAGNNAIVDGSPITNNAALLMNARCIASQVTGVGSTSIAASAELEANSVFQGTMTVNGVLDLLASRLVAGPGNLDPYATTSVFRVLTIAGGATPTGTVNLNDNNLIIAGGGAAARDAAQADVAYARHGGLWNRPGITSSNAKAAFAATSFDSQTLGVVLNGDLPTPYTTFGGQPVYPTDVLIAFTYGGDADLNGTINTDDYFQIDRGFLDHYAGWVNGDFNYDGAINGLDYFIIDSNFIDQSGQLAAPEVLAHAAEFGPSYLSQFTPSQLAIIGVPEPGSLLLLGLGIFWILPRRRRQV